MIDRFIEWYFEGNWLRWFLAFQIGVTFDRMFVQRDESLSTYFVFLSIVGGLFALKSMNDRTA